MERERYIEMRTLTDALAARNILADEGIRSEVMRNKKSKRGCGYVLMIHGDISAAENILAVKLPGGIT